MSRATIDQAVVLRMLSCRATATLSPPSLYALAIRSSVLRTHSSQYGTVWHCGILPQWERICCGLTWGQLVCRAHVRFSEGCSSQVTPEVSTMLWHYDAREDRSCVISLLVINNDVTIYIYLPVKYIVEFLNQLMIVKIKCNKTELNAPVENECPYSNPSGPIRRWTGVTLNWRNMSKY